MVSLDTDSVTKFVLRRRHDAACWRRWRKTTTVSGGTTTTTALERRPRQSRNDHDDAARKVPVLIFLKVLGPTTGSRVQQEFSVRPRRVHVVAKLEIPRPYINGKRIPATREVVLSTRGSLWRRSNWRITFNYKLSRSSLPFHPSPLLPLSLVTTVTVVIGTCGGCPFNK